MADKKPPRKDLSKQRDRYREMNPLAGLSAEQAAKMAGGALSPKGPWWRRLALEAMATLVVLIAMPGLVLGLPIGALIGSARKTNQVWGPPKKS
jgi:hypothetical protein